MALDRYTVLHRKDERGVIVESKVFGPDDEIPEGFQESTEYTPVHSVREDEDPPLAESKLTVWENPMQPSFVVDPLPEETVDEVDATEAEAPEDSDELDEGSPRQAREEAEDGELTGAEEEADESLEGDEADESGAAVPPQGGPGSGKDVWAQYAAANGVEVPEGASRDEIIAACEKAGVPVD